MCNSWAVDRYSSDPLSPFPSVHLSLSLVCVKFLRFHVFEICERTLLTVADAKCTFCKSVSIGSIAVGTLARSWHIWRTHEHVCPHQHTVFFSKFVKLGFPLSFFFLLSHRSPSPLPELISMLRVCVFHLGLPLEIFVCLCCSARRGPNSGGLIPGRGRPLKGPLVLSGQAPFRE